MKSLPLSLRQRKLLHTLQHTPTYITGNALARDLGVSGRTIRSDITEINAALLPHGASIDSVHSKGYSFHADDPSLIEELNRIETSILNKEDRIRYLAMRLCLAEEPINLYDLEDEMCISHTTLEHDLRSFRLQCVESGPRIRLIQKKDEISLEKEEGKIRRILTHLFYDDWNYNTKFNAFYSHEYLDQAILEDIMDLVPGFLQRYRIHLEDSSLIYIFLSIAVMYQRLMDGHALPETLPLPATEPRVYMCCQEIFAALEKQLLCAFPAAERDVIYDQICLHRLLDIDNITRENLTGYIGPVTLEIVDLYLARIRTVFGIDFTQDDDFYVTLSLYIRDLRLSRKIMNAQGNRSFPKESILFEYEIAYLFQNIAQEYMQRYLSEIELIYLSYCISGGLELFYQFHPELKTRVALFCHRNLPAGWALKRKLLALFEKNIDLVCLLPVNAWDAFDFATVDLALFTVDKSSIYTGDTPGIVISPDLNKEDAQNISRFIWMKQLEFTCPRAKTGHTAAFREAFWHEKAALTDKLEIIETLANDLIADGAIEENYLLDVLRRESITSYATRPGVVFLHSLIPAKKTRLSIMTLEHRADWNSYKIRTVVFGAFMAEDVSLIIHIKHIFFNTEYDMERCKTLKTRKEVMDFFCMP